MTRTDVKKAREALHALHTKALGNDYANEYELRSQFYAIDDVLEDVLDTLPDDGTKEGA